MLTPKLEHKKRLQIILILKISERLFFRHIFFLNKMKLVSYFHNQAEISNMVCALPERDPFFLFANYASLVFGTIPGTDKCLVENE